MTLGFSHTPAADSPRRRREREEAIMRFAEDQTITLWTDASVSPEHAAIAVVRAHPAEVLANAVSQCRSALRAEREALRAGVEIAVGFLESGETQRVLIRFDNPQARRKVSIPAEWQHQIKLQRRPGEYNLAHSPATNLQRRLAGRRRSA